MKKATRQHTKEHNRNLVLKTIFDRESISRAEIARVTGLTRTTVSDIVADLLEESLVSEIGVGSSLGGKSPVLLGLVEDSRHLIGLDLAREEFRGAIVNLRGKTRQIVTLPINGKTGDEALALVYEILDRLMGEARLALVGIGIGTPGLVNITEGTVVNSVNLAWKDLPLARLMEERYHLPVYILNDSQAAAMAEYTYGKSHPSESNLIVINARHGIGAGIIINGRLFQGDGGSAGEIGHVVVVAENGEVCRCGNRGCLETVASTQALIKQVQSLAAQSGSARLPKPAKAQERTLDGAQERTLDRAQERALDRAQERALDSAQERALDKAGEITLDLIEQAFAAGDPLVREAVLETGRYMGMAVSSLVGTLNIQKIVLTGDMTRFGRPWLQAIQGMVSQATLSRMAQNTQIEIGELGENDIILGASAVLASNYSHLFRSQPMRG